jgi:hypothetical protein
MEDYYLFAVEALDDNGTWKAIDVFAGIKGSSFEKDAYALMDTWVAKGWPASKITVNVSRFSSKNKNINID